MGGILHVVGWEAAFGGPQMGERLYDLNYLRESILEPATLQVWWMPVAFRDAFMLLAIDMWSMVRLKPMLASDDEYVELSPLISRIVRTALGIAPLAPIPFARLSEVIEVFAPYVGFRDADLDSVRLLFNLRLLRVMQAKIQDLSPVRDLKKLEVLWLIDAELPDIDLLAGSDHLTGLSLSRNRISDVSSISTLFNLVGLDLSNTLVSNITPLAELPVIEELNLTRTKVADLSPLESVTSLQELDLTETLISDISPLSGLNKLKYLDLSNTSILDIKPLLRLTSLRYLDLTNTKVPPEIMLAFVRAHPNCRLMHDSFLNTD